MKMIFSKLNLQYVSVLSTIALSLVGCTSQPASESVLSGLKTLFATSGIGVSVVAALAADGAQLLGPTFKRKAAEQSWCKVSGHVHRTCTDIIATAKAIARGKPDKKFNVIINHVAIIPDMGAASAF